MDHHQPTKTAQRSRASLIVLIVLAFLLMAAAVILVTNLPDDNAWQVTADTTAAGAGLISGFSCTSAEAQQMTPFAGGVMKMTGSRLTYLDLAGAEIYSVDVDFTSPFAVQQGDWFLAADRDGHAYVLLTPTGEAGRGTLAGRISGGAIGRNGEIALVQDQIDSTGLVTVLEAGTGNPVFHCEFPESGYVLSVSFSPDGGYFDVALVNTDASAVHPVIKRFSVAGEQQGQRLPDLDSLYPLIAYDQAGHPVLCSSTDLAALSYKQDELIWQAAFFRIESVLSTDDGLLVLASARADDKINLYYLQDDGKVPAGLVVGDTATIPAVSGHLTVIGSGTRLMVVDGRTGKLVDDRQLAAEIIRAGFADAQNLTVVTRTGVYHVPVLQ